MKSKSPPKRSAAKAVVKARKPTPRVAQIKTVEPKPRSDKMNEQFSRQAQDMFRAAQDARIPESVQAIAEDGVTKTREAYQKLQGVAKDNAKVVEEVVLVAQAGAKAIGEKVLHNSAVNTEAVFDAAQAIARARSLPEAARLQADFMQQQLAAASLQTKELLELSGKVARQTIESMNAAASRSFEQMKR